ncbi:MAG: hypothetical protein IJA60_02595 [Clostridia bacterium]|nr:hypothetical protein [Clostridia bacterium]
MFKSTITAKELIAELKNEVDIAIPISDASYVLWLNALEQLLYTEIIQQQKCFAKSIVDSSVHLLSVCDIPVSEDESPVRFEDIYAVYVDDVQLIKSTVASGVIFPNTFFKNGSDIGLNIPEGAKDIKIIYFVKPALKTVDEGGNAREECINIPIEFMDLVKAKLRGEAYKTANEDVLAAKWLNDYNILLETFKAWISNKAAQFGM